MNNIHVKCKSLLYSISPVEVVADEVILREAETRRNHKHKMESRSTNILC